MKRGRMAVLFLWIGCMLTGCGGFSPDISGISIKKDGKVTEVVRENFAQGYYDKKELESEIDAQVESYNAAAGAKAVRKRGFSVKNDVAQLKMTYASAADYAKFNGIDLYVGDIPGAVQAGYTFDGQFAEVSNGTVREGNAIWGSQIMTGSNYHTVAVREPLLVEVPGTIRYVSRNVKVTDKSTAVIEEKQTAYILYE